MTSKNVDRLSLHREVVRVLSNQRLAEADGGNLTPYSVVIGCVTDICSASSCCPGMGCDSAASGCGAGC